MKKPKIKLFPIEKEILKYSSSIWYTYVRPIINLICANLFNLGIVFYARFAVQHLRNNRLSTANKKILFNDLTTYTQIYIVLAIICISVTLIYNHQTRVAFKNKTINTGTTDYDKNMQTLYYLFTKPTVIENCGHLIQFKPKDDLRLTKIQNKAIRHMNRLYQKKDIHKHTCQDLH